MKGERETMGVLMYNGKKVGHGTVNTIYTGEIGVGATVTPDVLLNGETAWNDDGERVTGTMPNNEAYTNTPTTSGRVNIPLGYHNGDGYIDTSSVYNAGVEAGKTIAISSMTLVNHKKDEKGTNFFNSGASGTRWSWTNDIGDCKLIIYVAVSKSDWDGSSGVYGYVGSNQVFYKDIYSAYYHGISVKKGQTFRLDARNTNTILTDCIVVAYALTSL